jgi:hypothetical protein
MTREVDAAAGRSRYSDATLTLEFAYTTWEQSCRDLYTIDQACRRPRGHDGEHAAGYGGARSRWQQ